MKRRPIVLLLGVLLASSASAQSSPGTVMITVLPDHYVLAGRVYNDLHRLEDAVRALRPKSMVLDACGPRETRAMVAAAHRFRDLPTRIRSLSLSQDAACSPPTLVSASLRTSGGPTGIDDRAVSEYWSGLRP